MTNLSIFTPLPKDSSVKAEAKGATLDRVLKRNAKEASSVIAKPSIDYLNLSYFKKPGTSVTTQANKSSKSYIVTFAKQIMAKDMFLDFLRTNNPDNEFYDADIDENELINKTSEPLWAVCRKGNSYIIKRNN